jgi:hypothetical protein
VNQFLLKNVLSPVDLIINRECLSPQLINIVLKFLLKEVVDLGYQLLLVECDLVLALELWHLFYHHLGLL